MIQKEVSAGNAKRPSDGKGFDLHTIGGNQACLVAGLKNAIVPRCSFRVRSTRTKSSNCIYWQNSLPCRSRIMSGVGQRRMGDSRRES
jgi:hypothetical protein